MHERYGDNTEARINFIRMLKEQLVNKEDAWEQMLMPIESDNGEEDSLYRLVLEFKHFQTEAFELSIEELDRIGRQQ
jgi:hypothetical protein